MFKRKGFAAIGWTAAAFLIFSMSACADKTAEAGQVKEEAAGKEMVSVATLKQVEFQPNSVGENLYKAIQEKRDLEALVFSFSHLSFPDSSSYIAVTQGMSNPPEVKEIDQLASIMLAYPRLEIRLTLSSGLSGDAEKDAYLARQRAMFIKSRLAENGVDPVRVEITPLASTEKTEKDNIELSVLRLE